MKKKKNFLFGVLVFITIVFLVVLLTPKEIQNDLFYDIKLGDWMRQHGIDLKDHFSFIPLAYTYPHWLFDILVSFIYTYFSFQGIYIFVMLSFAFLLFLIYKVSNRMNHGNKIISYVLLFLVSNLVKPGITARCQLLSYLLFVIQIYLLESFVQAKKKRYLAFLPLLSFILANVHGTIWPFQIVLYLPYIAEHVVYLIKKKKKIKVNVSAHKLYVADCSHFKFIYFYLFLSLLTGLLTPSFGIAYTYFIKIMQTSTVSLLLEHQPTVLIQNLSYLFVLIFLFLLFILTKTKIRLRDFLMIGGLVFMSFFAVRHILLFAVIGLLFVGRYLSDLVNEESKSTCFILYSYVSKPIVVFLLFALFLGIGIGSYHKKLSQPYFSENDYPVLAVDYIKEHLDYTKIRLYNNYNEGSYLLFRDLKVFVDSRSDLYTSAFNPGITIFDDYVQAYFDLSYEDVFEKYKITHVLIRKEDHLYKLLKKDSNYKELYQDSNFVLLQKVES